MPQSTRPLRWLEGSPPQCPMWRWSLLHRTMARQRMYHRVAQCCLKRVGAAATAATVVLAPVPATRLMAETPRTLPPLGHVPRLAGQRMGL